MVPLSKFTTFLPNDDKIWILVETFEHSPFWEEGIDYAVT